VANVLPHRGRGDSGERGRQNRARTWAVNRGDRRGCESDAAGQVSETQGSSLGPAQGPRLRAGEKVGRGYAPPFAPSFNGPCGADSGGAYAPRVATMTPSSGNGRARDVVPVGRVDGSAMRHGSFGCDAHQARLNEQRLVASGHEKAGPGQEAGQYADPERGRNRPPHPPGPCSKTLGLANGATAEQSPPVRAQRGDGRCLLGPDRPSDHKLPLMFAAPARRLHVDPFLRRCLFRVDDVWHSRDDGRKSGHGQATLVCPHDASTLPSGKEWTRRLSRVFEAGRKAFPAGRGRRPNPGRGRQRCRDKEANAC